jgi:hypothetical protein
MDNLDDDANISRSWESVWEHLKASATESLGYCEFKQHKPWFYEECSKELDESKQAIEMVAESKSNRWG